MSTPLVPPLAPSAVYTFPDLDALDAAYGATPPDFTYCRDGHPNARFLADVLTKLHGGTWGQLFPSGMAAVAGALVPLLKTGSRVVASNQLYGKSTKLLAGELSRFGVATTFVDTADLAAVRAALREPAAAVLVETVSNPLCRVADLPALAPLAHAAGAKLVVDNTFASPVLCRPLALGADVVMESLTKIIGGHGDVMLGFLSGTDAAFGKTVEAAASTWGYHAAPFDCWLTARGLDTLELRVRAAAANCEKAADCLAGQPGVVRVVYPTRSDHPDHAVAKRVLPAGPGHVFAVELAGGRDGVNKFMRNAGTALPFAPSLGHATTTLSHPDTTSHRYVPEAEKRAMGITPGLIRVSVGSEPFEKLAVALAKGLNL
jgi:cystathionine beta-lyase/cystathionine gamma-synthase